VIIETFPCSILKVQKVLVAALMIDTVPVYPVDARRSLFTGHRIVFHKFLCLEVRYWDSIARIKQGVNVPGNGYKAPFH